MRKLLVGALFALLPAIGVQAYPLFSPTEISIRPLQPGLSVETGVLGTEVQFELNGQKVVKKAIYLTGQAASLAIKETNLALKTAGEATRYTFDASKQMIVITGSVAGDLIEKFAKKGFDAAIAGGRLANAGAQAVVYETKELASVSVAYVKLGLVSSVTYLKEGYTHSVAAVRYVAVETAETARDVAIVTYKGLTSAIEFSKELALDARDVTLTVGKATVLYVNDAGLFVYDHSKKAVLQLGSWTVQGLKLAKEGIIVTAETASKLQKMTLKGLKAIYHHLPRVGVTIEW